MKKTILMTLMLAFGMTMMAQKTVQKVDKKTVQVRVTIAYNSQMAMKEAKTVIKKQLEEKGEDLHDQLDAIWSQLILSE